MKKSIVAIMACVLTAFLVSGALADEGKKPDWKKGCPDGFVRKSLDRDGFVDLKALPKEVAPQVRDFLKKADVDKDAQVTKKEIREFVQKVKADKKAKMESNAKPDKERGPRPDFKGPRPDFAKDKCDKCPYGKAPGGKATWGAPFAPRPNFGSQKGPNPMVFAELMKKAYKDGFKDGFKAAMEMQKEAHRHHGPKPCPQGFDKGRTPGKPGPKDWHPGKPGPKDWKPAPRDGQGPDFDKKDRR
ncbi:MAG: hypothetical protein Q4D98_13635 [Planctomycetia bacterium]|nr:hypothetical protein [Planctomycetia bacterium]